MGHLSSREFGNQSQTYLGSTSQRICKKEMPTGLFTLPRIKSQVYGQVSSAFPRGMERPRFGFLGASAEKGKQCSPSSLKHL
jgi:hypothetical protein